MKRKLTNCILFVIFLSGLSLMMYPAFSNWWNSRHQTKAIAAYTEQVARLDKNQYRELWNEARDYNQSLPKPMDNFYLSEEQSSKYNQLLNVGDTGVMGYIEIPDIKVTLPIYHGTDEAVLQVAAGHLDWTSLPVGGKSTHCVISGHRGLPSAKLFTDIDRLKEGDIFRLRVLDEILTYRVDRILTVEPHEIQALQVEEGKDYCTLVTCTPYGINTHRLLVRGQRMETALDSGTDPAIPEAVEADFMIVVPLLVIPVLLVLFIYSMRRPGRKKGRKAKKEV